MTTSQRRIERQALLRKVQSIVQVLGRHLVISRHPPEEKIVSLEIGALAGGPVNLSSLNTGREGADDLCRDLVLQLKNVLDGAVETIRPQMRAGFAFDQLRGDA